MVKDTAQIQERIDQINDEIDTILSEGENKLFAIDEKLDELDNKYDHLVGEIKVYEEDYKILGLSRKKSEALVSELDLKINEIQNERKMLNKKGRKISSDMSHSIKILESKKEIYQKYL